MHFTALVLALGVIALGGCKSGASAPASTPGEEQVASDGEVATAASAQSTHLGSIVFEAVSSQDPEEAAGQLAPPTALYPSGCIERVRDPFDPRVAHVIFTDCTGPFGLVHLDGELVVTFREGDEGELHADIDGPDLMANHHPLAYSATADLEINGAERDVAWNGRWTATSSEGLAVDHGSTLGLRVDTRSGCVSSEGTGRTRVGARDVDTTFLGYRLCHDASGDLGCPTGRVTHHDQGNRVTVQFDGSDTAEVTSAGGDSFSVPVVCGGAGGARG